MATENVTEELNIWLRIIKLLEKVSWDINILPLLKNLHSAGKGHDIGCITEGHGIKD